MYRHHISPAPVSTSCPACTLQGAITVASLAHLQRAIRRQFGGATSAAFMLLTALQFHLPFYLSRTLPNVLAMPLTNLGLAAWLAGAPAAAVVYPLTAAAVSWRECQCLRLGSRERAWPQAIKLL